MPACSTHEIGYASSEKLCSFISSCVRIWITSDRALVHTSARRPSTPDALRHPGAQHPCRSTSAFARHFISRTLITVCVLEARLARWLARCGRTRLASILLFTADAATGRRPYAKQRYLEWADAGTCDVQSSTMLQLHSCRMLCLFPGQAQPRAKEQSFLVCGRRMALPALHIKGQSWTPCFEMICSTLVLRSRPLVPARVPLSESRKPCCSKPHVCSSCLEPQCALSRSATSCT